ncbi:MAG TPA: hypothetical protein VGI45_19145 [Terracidiphilus sp.]
MRFLCHLVLVAVCIPSVAHLRAQAFDGGVTETLQSIYIPPLVGAPFSAIVHTEWTRPLPGGGSYTMVNQRSVARDGHGRIYEERWLLVPKDSGVESRMNVIQIADPNQHTLYNCFVFERRCTLLKFAEQALTSYQPLVVPTGPIDNNKGFTTHLDLGIRSIAGFDTSGTRETTTLLPGAVGNDRVFVTTREFWQAPQIGVNVLSIVDGPQTGKQSFTVSDVSLTEPDPQLFELPEGYEILDRRQPGHAPNKEHR